MWFTKVWKFATAVGLIACLCSSSGISAAERLELLARGSTLGTASDLSGLKQESAGTPQDQLGGFSAIAYTGTGNRYIVLPDRGPAGGSGGYRCRFHEMELTVSTKAQPVVSVKLLATHLLTDEQGRSFVGLSSAIDEQHPEQSLRLDPEGVRVGSDGTIYICDEYGPHVLAFDAKGRLQRRLPVPKHFQVSRPAATREEEHAANQQGRQTNRGLEGLALTSDGKFLYAIMQGPLLQDHPFDSEGERLGVNVRIWEINLSSGHTRELVYVLDRPGHGISEILSVDASRFIVLERDNKPGSEAKTKRLYEIDITAATDVSQLGSLPAAGLPEGVQAVGKRPFLDFLDEKLGLRGNAFPEKLEGLSFGPDLTDGRRLLIISSDNDFVSTEPSWFWAFSVARDQRVRTQSGASR